MDRKRFALCALLASICTGSGPGAATAQDAPAETGSGVVRAMFALAIADREPVDVVSEIDTSASQVYFFSELRGLQGQTVRHRWERQGELMGEVSFEVRADRWRVYSSKKLLPGWIGTWTVSVVDESGRVLKSANLSYGIASNEENEDPLPAAPRP
jgi:hypothetical protein